MQNAEKGEFGVFDASSYKVGIVSAQFNKDIADALLKSALAKCEEYKILKENITVYKVPGSVEIPVILEKMAESKKYDCLVALGTIIRGGTPHFDYVAKIVSEGVLRVMLDHCTPVGFGVLTCDNKDQALARPEAGAGAMEAGLQSAKILKSM
jgi:6,7-dimethyl-8-ribityllumazine synthase